MDFYMKDKVISIAQAAKSKFSGYYDMAVYVTQS
jgi:hypothetical protein